MISTQAIESGENVSVAQFQINDVWEKDRWDPYNPCGGHKNNFRRCEPVDFGDVRFRARFKSGDAHKNRTYDVDLHWRILSGDDVAEVTCCLPDCDECACGPEAVQIEQIYLIQENNASLLPMEKGYHHCIWNAGVQIEEEVWFHGTEEYNIAVDVSPTTRKLVVMGYYYRYHRGTRDMNLVSQTNYSEPLQIPEKVYTNISADTSLYTNTSANITDAIMVFLDGFEERTINPTTVPRRRRRPGRIQCRYQNFETTSFFIF